MSIPAFEHHLKYIEIGKPRCLYAHENNTLLDFQDLGVSEFKRQSCEKFRKERDVIEMGTTQRDRYREGEIERKRERERWRELSKVNTKEGSNNWQT